AVQKLCADGGFAAYYEVSARTDRGVPELRKAIAEALDWDAQATVIRPEGFQRIRDEVDGPRRAGKVTVSTDELRAGLGASGAEVVPGGGMADPVSAVDEQLAAQGVVALTRLSSGKRMVVLQVERIERYAGALILAARNNPRGVPALEERRLAPAELLLPGFRVGERLPAIDEAIVLECVVELLIEHGICFRHERLLIFPTLFPAAEEERGEKLAHSVSLYYDFTGAIDNIYASLVAWLMIGGQFGDGRLWPGRAEFDAPGKGLCGIRQIK